MSSGTKEKPTGNSPAKSVSSGKSGSSSAGKSKKQAGNGKSQTSFRKKENSLVDVSSFCVFYVTLVF